MPPLEVLPIEPWDILPLPGLEPPVTFSTGAVDLPLTSRAAVLMEKTTGQMLFAQNEHEKLEPASVTKIMTLLLTMDAIDSGALAYDDVVTVSANAAGIKSVKPTARANTAATNFFMDIPPSCNAESIAYPPSCVDAVLANFS